MAVPVRVISFSHVRRSAGEPVMAGIRDYQRPCYFVSEFLTQYNSLLTILSGDSYSSVGQGAAPTPLLPLGVPYPGTQQGLWNEPTLPNWVGHLLVKHRVGPRYNPDVAHQDAAWLDNPLLVHNYATGGAEVCDVDEQISSFLQDRSHLAQRETLFGPSSSSKRIT